MITEDQLDNLLVAQKDRILEYINGGHFDEARTVLCVLAPLWKACRYEYKLKELHHRLEDFSNG